MLLKNIVTIILFILNFLGSLINAVKAFDDYLKQYQIVSATYIKIFSYLANKINYNNFDLWKKIILIINIVPHLILLCIVSLDIFYFHKLFYFYKAIWITLFFFLIPFTLYSFNFVCEHYIIYWEKNSDYVTTNYKPNILPPELDFWHPDYYDKDDDCSFPPGYMQISIRKFLPIYLDEVYYEQKTPYFTYHIIPTKECYEELFKKYNLTWKTCNSIIEKVTKDDMDLVLHLTAIQTSYDILNKHTNILSILKNIRIVIYAGYLICWISILVTSLHNFKDFYLLYYIMDMLKNFILQSKLPIKSSIVLMIITFFNHKDDINKQ